MTEERLQKIIARAGITSRRAAEELIRSGRVRVNGRIVTELGQKADRRRDRIEVDGKRLVPEAPIYIVLHKPRNVVSTLRDPEGRPTVAELVRDAGARLYPIGRLDFATSGVLLMTNDGDFANAMLHPRGGVPKTYVAKLRGVLSEEDLEPWRRGVRLEDGMTLPAEARLLRHEGDKTWIELTLREGRNQQIRRMGEATGWPVMRLARMSFAGVTSEGLRPGAWRPLTADELIEIRKQFGVPRRIRGAAAAAPPEETGARGAGRPARSPRPGRPDVRGSGPPDGARSQRPRGPRPAEAGAPAGPPARSARTGRSGTTPRGAATRAPRGRGPADR
ncbi:MAG: pseudouridine synthase [Polyangiaceae bacterium]|nr:pseudouridine synthase [Polyangiaceae bacterium]